MFRGATSLNLDAKGRLAIPTKHRDALQQACEGNLVLTAHLRLDYGFGDVEKKDEMFTSGGVQQRFYSTGRVATHNATGGLMIGLNYKFVKKEKEKPKDTKKPAETAKPKK